MKQLEKRHHRRLLKQHLIRLREEYCLMKKLEEQECKKLLLKR